MPNTKEANIATVNTVFTVPIPKTASEIHVAPLIWSGGTRGGTRGGTSGGIRVGTRGDTRGGTRGGTSGGTWGGTRGQVGR